MKRIFTLLLSMLMLLPAWAKTVHVTLKKQSACATLQIVPYEGTEPVEIGEPSSNTYSFDVEAGKYWVSGYSEAEVCKGKVAVTFDNDTDMTMCYGQTKATNSGWEIGKDYTIKIELFYSDMTQYEFALGMTDAQDASTFIVPSGSVYAITLAPCEEHAAEGYVPYYESNTITGAKTVNKAIPLGKNFTLTVPKDATPFVGSKLRHFVPFMASTPTKTEEVSGKMQYTYFLAEKGEYNYRVSMPGKLTLAKIFKMGTEDSCEEVTEADMEGNPKQIDRDVASNNKYNVADVFTNCNAQGCMEMKTGDQKQIVTLRTWEIVNSVTGNYFIEPDYHFTVVDENGKAAKDVVEVSADGVVTAKKKGTAFVLVTYDALKAVGQAGGPLFGAIWPENTGVIVVNVDATAAGIKPNMTINEDMNPTTADKMAGTSIDAEMDVLYFPGNFATYTFTPEGATSVALASPTITKTAALYSGFSPVKANADGSYTLHLSEGRNIVKLSSENGSMYQVIRAKKCDYTIANATNPGEPAKPGDELSVTVAGLYHPAHKLAGVYNMSASIQYNDMDGKVIASKANQYQFTYTDAARTVSVTIPETWNTDTHYFLTGGVIKSSGYGDPYGGHREIDYLVGKNPNFSAVQHISYFGALPNIELYKPASTDYDLKVLTFEDADYKGEGNFLGYKDWSSLIDSPQYGGTLLYGNLASSYCWWDENNTDLFSSINAGPYGTALWSGGMAISNYVMNDFKGATSNEQLAAYNPTEGGKGGHNDSDNFLVCVGYDDGSKYGTDSRPILSFDSDARVIDHAYVNLNCYGLNSAVYGDSSSPAATESDYLDIVAEALDVDGEPTGTSIKFRAIDGKDDILMTWKKWDMSELGECFGVRFNIVSSLENSYGLSYPAYFLLDDIAVRIPKKPSAIDTVEVDSVPTGKEGIYNLQGIRLNDISQPGIYIVNGKKVFVK